MSIFKTRVKIYNVFIKRLSHATGSLLGSWKYDCFARQGQVSETEPPHCALGLAPPALPSPAFLSPCTHSQCSKSWRPEGKNLPLCKAPPISPFPMTQPLRKRTAFIIQTLQSDNWLYHHCGRPPLLSASHPVCISPWLIPAWTFSPPVLVCEFFQDKRCTSHFSSMFSRI